MIDRKLLELAAKALRYEVADYHRTKGLIIDVPIDQPIKKGGLYWNPQDDDGDSMRLAINLGISIEFVKDGVRCRALNVEWMGEVGMFCDMEHLRSATRSSVLRVAAEIGKGMK